MPHWTLISMEYIAKEQYSVALLTRMDGAAMIVSWWWAYANAWEVNTSARLRREVRSLPTFHFYPSYSPITQLNAI